MAISETFKAASRVLLDSPEILQALKDLSDDQRALNLAFTQAVTELRSQVSHLTEGRNELRELLGHVQAEVTALRVTVATSAKTSDVGRLQERLVHLEGLLQGASMAISLETDRPHRRPPLPLPGEPPTATE